MTAVMPSSSGASWAERKMVVGPSAPPMMPIDAASGSSKTPVASAPQKATNMPTCAAAPSSSVLGLEMTGLKSVSAPSPRKMIGGRMFQNERP